MAKHISKDISDVSICQKTPSSHWVLSNRHSFPFRFFNFKFFLQQNRHDAKMQHKIATNDRNAINLSCETRTQRLCGKKPPRLCAITHPVRVFSVIHRKHLLASWTSNETLPARAQARVFCAIKHLAKLRGLQHEKKRDPNRESAWARLVLAWFALA